MNIDYKKLEVIVIHKPDLKKVEIELLKFHGYNDNIKNTLFKIVPHSETGLEQKKLANWDIDASYETTGYDTALTYDYCHKSKYTEDYFLYLTGQVTADIRD